MREERLAYRHLNGEIEGFYGYGFSADAARKSAEKSVRAKVVGIDHLYDPSRIVVSMDSLKPGEMERIQRDWALAEGRERNVERDR